MTIALGPTSELAAALRGRLDDVVVVDADGSVDDTVWRALVALQTAHASMTTAGRRIVVVLPTIGMAGAAGLVDYTTALEGIRAMVKSAARQWAADGIGVNMVAAPVRLFRPETDDSHLTAAAVQGDDTLIRSVVETADFLLRADLGHLTGETVIVDGGSVMAP